MQLMESSKLKTTNKKIRTNDLIDIVRGMSDGQDLGSSEPVHSSIVMEAVLNHMKDIQRQLERCELTMQMMTGPQAELFQKTLNQNRVERGEI